VVGRRANASWGVTAGVLVQIGTSERLASLTSVGSIGEAASKVDVTSEGVKWGDETWYRVLSYYFSLRSNNAKLGEYARYVLDSFQVPRDPGQERNPPTPNLPPVYSLLDVGEPGPRRFRLLYGADPISGAEEPDLILDHLFWHINAEAARQTGDYLLFHAGAVSMDGQGVVLPGASGTGKTTLVAGLVVAGFDYLSDEAAAIDPISGLLHPYPKALTLKSRFLFDLYPHLERNRVESLVNGQYHLPIERVRPGAMGGPCRIRYFIFPKRTSTGHTRWRTITPGAAALELGRNAMNLTVYGARALPVLADIIRHAVAVEMEFADLNDALPAIQAVIKKYAE